MSTNFLVPRNAKLGLYQFVNCSQLRGKTDTISKGNLQTLLEDLEICVKYSKDYLQKFVKLHEKTNSSSSGS